MRGAPEKNRGCPWHKHCWDYGNCASCDLGKEFYRLHCVIERLKRKLEKEREGK